MLTDWNFRDNAANSTIQQINRQKSARNLQILQFDPSEPRAVFSDPTRSDKHTATLRECSCRDFNFTGTNPRKTFKPCMHIYRLAIELGLIDAKYLDHRARFAQASMLSREETQRLQDLRRDASQWGGWSAEIHKSGVQRNRQYRGYAIIFDEHEPLSGKVDHWNIHGYDVNLDACECMDFVDRRLPCKHIYAAAIASKIALPFTQKDYESAKRQGIEIVYEFPTGI